MENDWFWFWFELELEKEKMHIVGFWSVDVGAFENILSLL